MGWIIPANLKYYDVFGELKRFDVIEWRQRLKNVCEGDAVYIYLSALQRYIAFKCIVEKANIRRDICEIDDSNYFRGDSLKAVPLYMRLRPKKEYASEEITGKTMRDAGIPRILSQRQVNDTLSKVTKSNDIIK